MRKAGQGLRALCGEYLVVKMATLVKKHLVTSRIQLFILMVKAKLCWLKNDSKRRAQENVPTVQTQAAGRLCRSLAWRVIVRSSRTSSSCISEEIASGHIPSPPEPRPLPSARLPRVCPSSYRPLSGWVYRQCTVGSGTERHAAQRWTVRSLTFLD